MSGTSLDGVDGVLVSLDPAQGQPLQVRAHAFCPFDADFRAVLLALNTPGDNELHTAALAANRLARIYAQVCKQLLQMTQCSPQDIVAVGAHGQTVRHRPLEFDPDPQLGHPAVGYTLQLNNPSLLAELTGIDVVADFRTRDLAAGGQGAPLVPAFHQAIFAQAGQTVAALNIGGISNLSLLHAGGEVTGFDCGPGNALMDYWCQQHTGHPFDEDGVWAASGQVQEALLERWMQEPFLQALPPKSTGRDLFNPTWLHAHLNANPEASAVDVQASLCEFTARVCAQDLRRHAPLARQLWVCGGGALNGFLMQRLAAALPDVRVQASDDFGLPALQVEAAAFAWLARQTMRRETASLQKVTGAKGARVLGAIYPA